MPNTQHDPKSEGAEWEQDADYILYNLRNAIKHEVEGTNIGPYKDEVKKYKAELKAFIAHQRQQAYAEGYKQGSFDKEADLELGLIRQQAVAEFAREVVAMNYGVDQQGRQWVDVADIHTPATERGIELDQPINSIFKE